MTLEQWKLGVAIIWALASAWVLGISLWTLWDSRERK